MQKSRLVVVHVVQDRRGTCTTEIPQAVDKHGQLRSTIGSRKRPICCAHLYLTRLGGSPSIYCQGEGRGFESRRPLQKTRRPLTTFAVFLGLATLAAVPTGLSGAGGVRFQEDRRRPFDRL